MKTLQEAAEEYVNSLSPKCDKTYVAQDFIAGANWQRNSVWHEPEDKPAYDKYIIVYSTDNGVHNGLATHYLDHWQGIKKWAYLSDILPDKNIY